MKSNILMGKWEISFLKKQFVELTFRVAENMQKRTQIFFDHVRCNVKCIIVFLKCLVFKSVNSFQTLRIFPFKNTQEPPKTVYNPVFIFIFVVVFLFTKKSLEIPEVLLKKIYFSLLFLVKIKSLVSSHFQIYESLQLKLNSSSSNPNWFPNLFGQPKKTYIF